MQAGRQSAVRPALQRLAHIHNHLARIIRLDSDELVGVLAVLEFEPAGGAVLEEEGDDAKVKVRPDAADLPAFQLGDVDGGVVVQAQFAGVGVVGDEAVEGARGDREGDFERVEDLRSYLFKGFKQVFHECSEAGEHSLWGPACGVLVVCRRSLVEMLLYGRALLARARLLHCESTFDKP